MTPPPKLAAAASPIQDFLEPLPARFAGLATGQVARYIPELAKADPSHFGIAIATADGQVYEVGHSRQRFAIQSVSKPLVYGAALEHNGPARVLQAVGVEPSGEAFDSISLEPGTGRPLNPMINAGAIAVASLIQGDTPPAWAGRSTRAAPAPTASTPSSTWAWRPASAACWPATAPTRCPRPSTAWRSTARARASAPTTWSTCARRCRPAASTPATRWCAATTRPTRRSSSCAAWSAWWCRCRRAATSGWPPLSAGMAFGEAAPISGGRRSADVNADTPVDCLTLGATAFARLESERPALMVRLLHNLLRASAETTVRLTREVAALEG